MNARAGSLVCLLVVGCSSPPPAAAPDPCDALYQRYESLRTSLGCQRAEDCAEAPGIRSPVRREESVMGPAGPCPTATRTELVPAVVAAAHAFSAAGCGTVAEIGSGCSGTHVDCLVTRCTASF
jgi:hypothetical protein